MKRLSFISRMLSLLLLVSLLLTGCGKKNDPAVPNTPSGDSPADRTPVSSDISETPEITEVHPINIANFTAEMEAATAGLSNDEAIDYWLQEALLLLEGALPEERQQQLAAVLDQLYEAGLLLEQALYDAETLLFTFGYESGIQGGLTLRENSPIINSPMLGATADPYVQRCNPDAAIQTIVFNGFEDEPYRTDYYRALYEDWNDMGVGLTLDSNVTIADLEQLDPYDVVVFSMHGSTYLGHPVLALNENATDETDRQYYQYLAYDQSVARVMYMDGTTSYWVLPDFFSNCYGSGDLEGKVFFSEACAFYGCDCYCTEADVTMASALRNASADAIMGYFNSVEANYSRNIMKTTLEAMYTGSTAYDALASAIGTYGETDNWEEPSEDKYCAYPLFMGDADTVLLQEEAPVDEQPPAKDFSWKDYTDLGSWLTEKYAEASDYDFGTPDVPAVDYDALAALIQRLQPEEDPNAQWLDYDYASQCIYDSLMEQLIGVYAEARRDGTFYLPYYNNTGYTFTVTIDLDYWYRDICVFVDDGYTYTLEPGDYIEIPVYFPEYCDAWNVCFLYQDIYYGRTYVG